MLPVFLNLFIDSLSHEGQYEVLDLWELWLRSFDCYKCLIGPHLMQSMIHLLVITVNIRSVVHPILSILIDPFFFLREY